jgi:hypothetical protein
LKVAPYVDEEPLRKFFAALVGVGGLALLLK